MDGHDINDHGHTAIPANIPPVPPGYLGTCEKGMVAAVRLASSRYKVWTLVDHAPT